jgi:hypothetical protein
VLDSWNMTHTVENDFGAHHYLQFGCSYLGLNSIKMFVVDLYGQCCSMAVSIMYHVCYGCFKMITIM